LENQSKTQSWWGKSRIFLGCCLLTLVFGTAAAAKIQGFNNFESTIVASLLVPMEFTRFVAVLIVTLEIVLTIGLFVPVLRKSSLQFLAGMVSVFLAYSTWRGLKGINVPCHCFGGLLTLTPLQSVLLNFTILIVVTSLMTCEARKSLT
jgi:fatty acid desaturase